MGTATRRKRKRIQKTMTKKNYHDNGNDDTNDNTYYAKGRGGSEDKDVGSNIGTAGGGDV